MLVACHITFWSLSLLATINMGIQHNFIIYYCFMQDVKCVSPGYMQFVNRAQLHLKALSSVSLCFAPYVFCCGCTTEGNISLADVCKGSFAVSNGHLYSLIFNCHYPSVKAMRAHREVFILLLLSDLLIPFALLRTPENT